MSESRNELPIDALVDNFLIATEEEDPSLHADLVALDDDGRRNLAGVLGRFDRSGKARLDATGRLLAARILTRLKTPTTEALATANKILDYIDLDANAQLDESEMELCVEILELFSSAESDNNTLSERELGMLYAVLRHLDDNDNHKLDAGERRELRKGLDEPEVFMAEQKRTNPLLGKFFN